MCEMIMVACCLLKTVEKGVKGTKGEFWVGGGGWVCLGGFGVGVVYLVLFLS